MKQKPKKKCPFDLLRKMDFLPGYTGFEWDKNEMNLVYCVSLFRSVFLRIFCFIRFSLTVSRSRSLDFFSTHSINRIYSHSMRQFMPINPNYEFEFVSFACMHACSCGFRVCVFVSFSICPILVSLSTHPRSLSFSVFFLGILAESFGSNNARIYTISKHIFNTYVYPDAPYNLDERKW